MSSAAAADRNAITVSISVSEAGADPQLAEQRTDSLRLDLLSLDFAEVSHPTSGVIPPGARGVDPVAIGELMVTIGTSIGLLRELVTAVANWRRSQPDSNASAVEIMIGEAHLKLDAATAGQQERLVDEFVKAVGGVDQ